jgi:aspartyl-tRNA(Asn)/glutamyl-tRNA(Gln) amidotransferase subunit A
VFTLPSAVAGLPALSLPCGMSRGLPVGVQVIGNFFDEGGVVKVSHALERELGFANRLPELAPAT